MNERHKKGNEPDNKEWLSKLTLPTAIYNEHTGSGSTLLDALHNGVVPSKNPMRVLSTPQLREAHETFREFFHDDLNKKDRVIDKEIIQLVLNFKGRREANENEWGQYETINRLGVDVNQGSIDYLVIDYVKFLRGEFSDFEARDDLMPHSLKYGTPIWNMFSSTYWRVFGLDVITANLANS